MIEAPGGKEATQIYCNAKRTPDLVILDLDMPHLNGEQTQRIILSVDDHARILFMSGHEDFVRDKSSSVGRAAGYLRKPCHVSLLLSTVSSVLAAHHGPAGESGENEEEELTRPGIGSSSDAE